MRQALLPVLVLGIMLSCQALGSDWPQWGGPNGNGVSPEKGLLKSWPKAGPKLAWTFEKAGMGYAAPVVVGGMVYMAGCRDNDEYLFCLDKSGAEKWNTKIGKVFDFQGNAWSRGPNASPAINGDYLVVLGSQGELLCVNPATGEKRWSKNLVTALGGQVNPIGGGEMGWGYAAAPLIDGDQVIVTPGGPGGLIAALDKKTGQLLWQSKAVPEQTTYAAPVLAEIGKVKQVIAMTQKGAVGVSTKDGSLLWMFKAANPYPDIVATSPVVHDDQVFLTAGFGGGADMLKVTSKDGKFTVDPVWSNKEIGNKQGGVVLVDKYLYGFHEARSWECQDWAMGEVKWSSKRRDLGAGSLIAADGFLICVGEDKGEVALLDAAPTGYKEHGRFTLPKASALRKPRGKVWTHPVLSDGLLYVRDQELVFCYEIK